MKSIYYLGLALLLGACGSTATEVTINGTGQFAGEKDNQSVVNTLSDAHDYTLRYAEINKIKSFDPLFALNPATQRFLQHIYEPLVKYDAEATIVPALARRYEVSADSLVYSFVLRKDVFFHDSEVFLNGRGRKLSANDVKFVFERMGNPNVPPDAANLFISIAGMEVFNLEQRRLYLAQDRTAKGVDGVIVQNDSTVIFVLASKDAQFLEKLASPLGMIYPKEALHETTIITEPVGTGPFQWTISYADTLHVLERNKSYRNSPASTAITRVEVIYESTQANLFKRFMKGDIDLIPSASAEIAANLLIPNGGLIPGYENRFKLVQQSTFEYLDIQFNPENRFGFTRNDAIALLERSKLTDYNLVRSQFLKLDKQYNPTAQNADITRLATLFPATSSEDTPSLQLVFNDDVISLGLLRHIYIQNRDQLKILLNDSRITGRNSFITITRNPVFVKRPVFTSNGNTLIRVHFDRYTLMHNGLENIPVNKFSWWMDVFSAEQQLAPVPAEAQS